MNVPRLPIPHPIEGRRPPRSRFGPYDWTLWIAGILCAILFFFALFTTNAQAAPLASHRGCSTVSVMGTLAADRWSAQIDTALTVGGVCDNSGTGDSGVTEMGANTAAGWRLACTHTEGGATGPQAATTAEARIYWDNGAFGDATISTTPAFARTISILTACPDGAAQVNQFVTTVYCTSDGTSTGTPRYGNQRIMVHVASTGGIAPYDLNSDTGPDVAGVSSSVGIVRCVPDVSATNVTATGTPYHHYVGGDTLRSSITASASDPYAATANQVRPDAVCGSTNAFPTIDLNAGTPTTSDQRIIGSPTIWTDDCALTIKWTHTNTTSISLYSGVPYGKWNSSSIPASTTIDATHKILTFDPTDDVDRTLFPTGTCSVQINGATAGTTANRKDAVKVTGCNPWQDARGNGVANNQPGRGWFQKSGDFRQTADYPNVDGLFQTPGSFPLTIQSTTTATTTTGLNYHKMVEEYDTTARTDTVLLNWGNSTGQFDVTATYVAANITNNKNGVNASAFTISADTEAQFVYFLHNAGLQPIQSVNVTCFRTRPDTSIEASVSFGPTDSLGNTSVHTYSVDAPSGTWQTTCSGTMNGNTFTYSIGYFHTSAFTADKHLNVKWNATLQVNGSFFVNITEISVEYDPTTDQDVAVFPDIGSSPNLNVTSYNPTTGRYDDVIFTRQSMLPTDGASSSSYYWTFYTTCQHLQDAFAFVNINFTGSPFVGGESYHVSSCVANAGITNGNFTGNFTGNVTIPSGASVDGVIQTAFDNFAPVLVWGGLILLFLHLRAWLPAIASLMALGDSILPTPVGNFGWRVMLVFIALFLHALIRLLVDAITARSQVRSKRA